MVPKGKKLGRPTELTGRMQRRILDMLSRGLTLKQVSQALGLGHHRIGIWRERFPHFSQIAG